MSALLIEKHSRYLFETSFEYQSTAYHVQSARMELCKYSMIIYFFLNDECAIVKETRFSLYGLGGLPSLLPINSPDIIAHVKGLSYLSDYMVIRATIGGAF